MIVETDEGYRAFKEIFEQSDSIVIPVFVDRYKHPLNNKVSLLYVKVLKKDTWFVLAFDHPEASSLPYQYLSDLHSEGTVYVLDRKSMVHVCPKLDMRDVNLMSYLKNGATALKEETYETKAHTHIYRTSYQYEGLNRVVPLLKHVEMCEEMASKVADTAIDTASVLKLDYWDNYNGQIIDNLAYVEGNGMYVDPAVFIDSFGDEQKRHVSDAQCVYSSYNLYTSTGRPSNKWGGVNFAALNKSDGSRRAFRSRFGSQGTLLQFDYDAFHFRLIASLIGYTIPAGTYFHEYLGKNFYFETDELTDEQYNESKRISFQYLYGNITKEIRDAVPFFDQTQRFIDYLWKRFRTDGFVKTPVYQKIIGANDIENNNPNKLFNYVIQNYEMETGSRVLEKLRKISYVSDYQSVPVLYTYDSFLFDYCLDDGREFIDKMISLVELAGEFPIKIEHGGTYQDLIKADRL